MQKLLTNKKKKCKEMPCRTCGVICGLVLAHKHPCYPACKVSENSVLRGSVVPDTGKGESGLRNTVSESAAVLKVLLETYVSFCCGHLVGIYERSKVWREYL